MIAITRGSRSSGTRCVGRNGTISLAARSRSGTISRLRAALIRPVGTHSVIAATTRPGGPTGNGQAVQAEGGLVDVLGVAAAPRLAQDLEQLFEPVQPPAGGRGRARSPSYRAATSCSERSASSTRPEAAANAGSRLPTAVTRRTGWVVSSLAMNTLSRPSRTVRQVVSLWRATRRRATPWNPAASGVIGAACASDATLRPELEAAAHARPGRSSPARP